jgi:hypothetical protein
MELLAILMLSRSEELNRPEKGLGTLLSHLSLPARRLVCKPLAISCTSPRLRGSWEHSCILH